MTDLSKKLIYYVDIIQLAIALRLLEIAYKTLVIIIIIHTTRSGQDHIRSFRGGSNGSDYNNTNKVLPRLHFFVLFVSFNSFQFESYFKSSML